MSEGRAAGRSVSSGWPRARSAPGRAACGRPGPAPVAVPARLSASEPSEAGWAADSTALAPTTFDPCTDRAIGRLRAVRYMARRIGLAVGLTFLTSCLGFLSVSANPIQLVREFSLVATLALSINFLITLPL